MADQPHHGIVREAGPHHRPGITAVFGDWSGGTWPPSNRRPIDVTQKRSGAVVGAWRMVGVETGRRHGELRSYTALLLEPVDGTSLEAGDMLEYGDG